MTEPGILVVGNRLVVYEETLFTSLRTEGAPLFAMHWLEATADRAIPLDLDWDVFAKLEAAGFLYCVAARVAETLIGYALYVLHPALHYRGRLIAQADAFFLRRSDRRGPIGIRLFRYAEDGLRKRGVHEVWSRVKSHVLAGRRGSDLRPLFARLGYREVETVMRKRLD